MLVLTTIMAGGLFYNEFAQLTDPGHIVGFWLGLVITVLGIVLLAKFSPPAEDGSATSTTDTDAPPTGEDAAHKQHGSGRISDQVSASGKGAQIHGVTFTEVADVQVQVRA